MFLTIAFFTTMICEAESNQSISIIILILSAYISFSSDDWLIAMQFYFSVILWLSIYQPAEFNNLED